MNKNKIKGSNFEREAAEVLEKNISNSKWKRIPSSGAMGTILGESLLTGDITGEVKNFPKKFKGECKIGYNNSADKAVKQFTIKKEWLDKIKMEANANFSVPFLIGKFGSVREGVKYFITLDIDTFSYLINMVGDLQRELELLYDKLGDKKDGK